MLEIHITKGLRADKRDPERVRAKRVVKAIDAGDFRDKMLPADFIRPGATPMLPALRLSLVLLSALLLLTSAVAQDGRVSFSSAITSATIPYANSIAAGDIEHNGKDDVGVAAATGDDQFACITLHGPLGPYWTWLGDGWGSAAYNCGIYRADYPGSILLADVNLDGNLDVITTNQEWIDTDIAFGDGHGKFTNGVSLEFACGDNTPAQAAVADMNGDGIPDVVVIYAGYRDVTGCVAVFLGKSGGEFGPPIGSSSGGDEPITFAVGDLNNDGIPDLVIGNNGGIDGITGNLAIMLGKGDGTFRPPVLYSAPTYTYFSRVLLADFNRDGTLDLAFTNYHTIYVALGKGDGTFSSPHPFNVRSGEGSLVAADLNGNDILDLVTTIDTGRSGGVAVFLGNGDGTFQPATEFKTGVNPTPAIGDFNGDGKPDIATVNGNSTLSILLNTTRNSHAAGP